MKLTTGRSIKYLFLTHLFSLILIVLYSLLIHEKLQISVLNTPYIIINIFYIYSRLFLPITAAALFIMLVMTDRISGKDKTPSASGAAIILSVLPAAIPSVIIYLLFVFVTEPVLIEKKEWLKQLSGSGKLYFEETIKNLNEGKLEEARVFADLYLYLDPDNKEINEKKSAIIIALPDNESGRKEQDKEIAGSYSEDFITGSRLLDTAEKYFKNGDYPSAVYYGQMAGRLKSSRKKAGEILKRAEKKLTLYTPDKNREERLYDGKLELEKLINEKEYQKAYYLFHQLSLAYKTDPELADMGEEVFSHLTGISFFYEDIIKFYFAPGKTEIAFVNKSDRTGKELILAEKIIFSGDSVYFFDIDIIHLSDKGEIKNQIHSMYGKSIDGDLNMLCIGRDTKMMIPPEVIKGKESEKIYSVKLEIPQEALLFMGLEDTRLRKIKTSYLADNLGMLAASGAGKTAPARELFIRFIRFFNFVFTLLAVMAAGISFLKRNRGKNYFSLILLPSAVFLIYLFENSIIYLKTGMITIFMGELGMLKTAIIYSIITFAEIFGILLFTINKASSIKNS